MAKPEANVAGLYSGHAPTPLTPRGVAQARALGEPAAPGAFR
ncbi:histidine phosphatase family protein [Klebsiella pneumoniae]